MANLPSGTVTFLFTDLEVSTRLWEQEPGAMMSRDGEQQLSLPIVRNDVGAAEAVRANLCPSCGSTSLVYEEGCKKCYACGHSEC